MRSEHLKIYKCGNYFRSLFISRSQKREKFNVTNKLNPLIFIIESFVRCGCCGARYLLLLYSTMFPQTTFQGWQERHEGSRLQVRPTIRFSLQRKGNVLFIMRRLRKENFRRSIIMYVISIIIIRNQFK